MPKKTLTVNITTSTLQGGVTRKTVMIPKGYSLSKVKLSVQTEFTQNDVNAVFGDYPLQPIIDNTNTFLGNENGDIIVWV